MLGGRDQRRSTTRELPRGPGVPGARKTFYKGPPPKQTSKKKAKEVKETAAAQVIQRGYLKKKQHDASDWDLFL
jgi:hypothetical protein